MSIARRAALAASALALVAGGLVVPALATSAPAWAQGSGIVPFTPDGVGSTFTIPTSQAEDAAAAYVVVGFVNDTGHRVTITSLSSSGGTYGDGGTPTIQPGSFYENTIQMEASGQSGNAVASVSVHLSNGQVVTWTVEADDFGTAVSIPSAYELDFSVDPAISPPLTNLEPPLAGTGSGEMVGATLAGTPATKIEDCVAFSFLSVTGTCDADADAETYLATLSAPVDISTQTSLASWLPGQLVGGGVSWLVDAVSLASGSQRIGYLALRSAKPASTRLFQGIPIVVAVPVMAHVADVIPAAMSVNATTTGTPVPFDAAPSSGVSLVSATLSGPDASDFKIEYQSANPIPPPADGGTWTPFSVKLTASTPGTYSAEVVATFDPSGGDDAVTIPVAGTIPARPGSGGASSAPPVALPVAPPPPAPAAVGETCGAGGTTVQLWGSDLAGSRVRFAGETSGVVTMLSATEAETTVPKGVDREGRIVVVGPGGQAVPVPDATWDPACPTEMLVWTTPDTSASVDLHVEVAANGQAIPGQTVVVLGKDGKQVARLTTTSSASSVVVPYYDYPFVAVFDGSKHWKASGSAPIH